MKPALATCISIGVFAVAFTAGNLLVHDHPQRTVPVAISEAARSHFVTDGPEPGSTKDQFIPVVISDGKTNWETDAPPWRRPTIKAIPTYYYGPIPDPTIGASLFLPAFPEQVHTPIFSPSQSEVDDLRLRVETLEDNALFHDHN